MEHWITVENLYLAPWATHSAAARARAVPEPEDPLRTVWQHDRDRIIHSKSFRRLKHKTQVFINPHDDHFRTRLTHTLEVAQISRVVSRALHLNEDLTEAIALGHDLGHTPFGHAGERALASVYPGFSHNRQSLRIVQYLEKEGRGLNLTPETCDGLLCHTGEQLPFTLEGAVVRLCDRVGYLNHDIDDAVRSGYLASNALPAALVEYLGDTQSHRINTMVTDIVATSQGRPVVEMSEPCAAAINELRAFMFQQVYYHPLKVEEENRLSEFIRKLFYYFCNHVEEMPPEFQRQPLEQAVCDYIAGMTDTYALELKQQLGFE